MQHTSYSNIQLWVLGLILLYYLLHILHIGTQYMLPNKDNFLWIDKNLFEIAALAVLYLFSISKIIDIDRWLTQCVNCKKQNHAI